MHRSEAQDLIDCSSCGAEVSLGADRVFVLSEDTALCFACAVKRGGLYDEAHDTWKRAPDLKGLEGSQPDY